MNELHVQWYISVPFLCVCQDTRDIIIELFQSLQHPYIYPVLDFQFTESDNALDEGETHAVLVMPFNTEGSLKDLIYGSAWQVRVHTSHIQVSHPV